MRIALQSACRRQRITIITAPLAIMLFALYATPRVIHLQSALEMAQSPTVSAKPQLDAPLKISSVEVVSTDPLTPQFSYVVTNISAKPIRAYAIRNDVMTGEQIQNSGVVLVLQISINSILRPAQSKSEAQPANTTYFQPLESILLSVDFVEFDDGTTWGADTFKSSERLAGKRAGGRAALNKLRGILRTHGPAILMSAVSVGNIDVIPEAGRSKEWVEGFQSGVGMVRNRLRRAKEKGGLTDVESELGQPFDASEGRLSP